MAATPWVGERFNAALGRWVVRLPDGRTTYRYRALMEHHLGRRLRTDEHVHHLNGDPADDRLENLQVLSESDHHALHAPESVLRYQAAQRQYDWSLAHEACVECGTTERPHMARGQCRRCYFRLRNRRVRGYGPRPRRRMIRRCCEHCGDWFERPAKGDGRPDSFCSRGCAIRWRYAQQALATVGAEGGE